MATIDYERLVNPALAPGLRLYIENGIEPGSFLCAVLRNDLKEACGRADYQNRHLLFEIVGWLYNHAPLECWGSEERYDAWIRRRGLKGRPGITCPQCGLTSYHPKDVSERYCGSCHKFHDDMPSTSAAEDPAAS